MLSMKELLIAQARFDDYRRAADQHRLLQEIRKARRAQRRADRLAEMRRTVPQRLGGHLVRWGTSLQARFSPTGLQGSAR